MEKIEIVLKKDSSGNDIELNKMSLEESKAIREILDALISIVEFEKDLDLEIGLKSGSAVQQIVGSSQNLKVVYNKIEEAANADPNRLNEYVNPLNIIHNNLKHFSDYKIRYKHNNSSDNIKPLFQKKFKTTRKRAVIENNFNIVFFQGTLELNGGKKPNFHISSVGEPYTIQCSKDEARKVNPFLYKEIKISAWAEQKTRGLQYTFCDIYAGESENYFAEFKTFFSDLKKKEGTEPFHFISEKLEDYYNDKNYAGAKKFIRIFLNQYSLPTYLRTILIMSKAFKNDEILGKTLENVEKLLESKIGKVY